MEQFSEPVDQLVAYEHTTNPIYYTMHFIEGPSDDIKFIVLVQRPSSLDTAYSLALLQEEVLDSAKRHDYRKPDQRFVSKPSATLQTALPLPQPPRNDKLPPIILPEEQKLLE